MLVTLAVLILAGAAAAAEEGFSYKKNLLGPGQWGCVDRNWTICRTGSQQSPIHIKSRDAVDNCELHELEFHFSSSNVTLVSERYLYKIVLAPNSNNTLVVDGNRYRLLQFHFHHPSEHYVDGKRYKPSLDVCLFATGNCLSRFDLEMHLVYQAMDNSSKLAVVGEMFKKGKCNSLVAKALELKNLQPNTWTIMDLKKHMKLGGEYFRYTGSLTTPPCTEGVTWTILLKHKTATAEQIEDMRKYLKGNNARPLQRANRREIQVYTYFENFQASA